MKNLLQKARNEPFKTFVIVAAVVALLLLAVIASEVYATRRLVHEIYLYGVDVGY